jgi:hypothetical protein
MAYFLANKVFIKNRVIKNLAYYLIALQILFCALTIIFFNGTGDTGDSILHYLFARYAPFHTELYFDHWAKPLFVLLASPFAQMGFVGLKIFNSIVSVATTFLTYKTAKNLNMRNFALVILLMTFAPLNYILTFSGLTEPLFALFLVLGIFLCLRKNYIMAALLISFLPYVRSEGLIIIGVFSLYFISIQKSKVIPLLFVGSIVYAVSGYFVHHDFLWVFTQIPYAKLSSVYGSGPITHFVVQLLFVVGVPVYILFFVGFLKLLFDSIKRKSNAEEQIFLFFGFSTFFIAHSLFWYLGIFNSYGLKRVLICVMPIIAIIALQGFNFLTEFIFKSNRYAKIILQSVLIIYVICFPFTPNPSAINWKEDMMLEKEQIIAIESSNFFLKSNSLSYPIIYNHYYLNLTLNIDPFDDTKHKYVSKENINNMKPGDILIWENIWAGTLADIKETEIDSIPSLEKVFTYNTVSRNNKLTFSGYVKK